MRHSPTSLNATADVTTKNAFRSDEGLIDKVEDLSSFGQEWIDHNSGHDPIIYGGSGSVPCPTNSCVTVNTPARVV